MTIEDILEETGGFGRFQLLVVLCISLNSFTIGWSMLQMVFSGFISEWYCQVPNSNQPDNGTLYGCSVVVNNNVSISDDVPCLAFQFRDLPLTIVNEWQLVCDLNYVRAAVTSIQMAGVLLGVILTGKLSDLIGRKKTMYIFVLEHAALNLIAAFSVTWSMFAVCRFFIGIGIGVIMVCSFPYSLEFLPMKWRSVVSALPVWTLGIAVFALAAWLLENWSHLHIACAALSFPGLLGYFYVPESLHWLTVHDQIKEAQEVVSKIAVANRKLQLRKASIMIQTSAWEEQKALENRKKFTYLDIFRKRVILKTTLVFTFHWFSLSLVYYGISFSVWNLDGNIYLNILLLGIVEIPAIFLTFFDKKIHRKLATIISLIVACLAVFACVLVKYQGPDDTKADITRGLCLVAKLGAGAAWSVVQSWGNELYPLEKRGHGLLTANISARVGAVIAPFLIDLEKMAVASFCVMGCLLFVEIVLCFITTEATGCKAVNSPAAASSPTTQDTQVYNIDMNHTQGADNESSSDVIRSSQIRVELEDTETDLGTIEEETSSNEIEQNGSTKPKENNHHAHVHVTFSSDVTDNETESTNVDESATSISDDSMKKKDIKKELKLSKISKKVPSLEKSKKNKQDKSKRNSDILPGKSKSKPKEEFPPYIESEYHKNIRYSIY